MVAGLGSTRLLCPSCGLSQDLWVGPAWQLQVQARAGARAVEGQATCFFHANRRADLACEACGRFVCALCDLPVAGGHLCPVCLEEGRAPQAKAVLDQQRLRWDKVLLSVAIFSWMPPILLVSFISAPAVVFLAIKHRNDAMQGLPTGRLGARARLLIAVLLSLGAIGLWIWLLAVILLKALA